LLKINQKKNKLDLVEGLNAIDSAIFLAQSLNIEMPIVNAINDILTKKADINEVIKNLLTRPITNEF
jgi:glycerol-3-phosphate dehydrogenase